MDSWVYGCFATFSDVLLFFWQKTSVCLLMVLQWAGHGLPLLQAKNLWGYIRSSLWMQGETWKRNLKVRTIFNAMSIFNSNLLGSSFWWARILGHGYFCLFICCLFCCLFFMNWYCNHCCHCIAGFPCTSCESWLLCGNLYPLVSISNFELLWQIPSLPYIPHT